MKRHNLLVWSAVAGLAGLLLGLASACSGSIHMFGNSTPQAEVTLAKGGQPCAAIILGEKATKTEWIAAQELASYVKAITGAELPVATEAGLRPKTANLILIGQPTTSKAIAAFNASGEVTVTADSPGLDGFVIKSVSKGGKNHLVLASAMARGCLYAVYHLLETQARVGFFPYEGEIVPTSPDLAFGPLDVSERPHFPDREYYQNCAFSYSSQFWGLPEWKSEIDWMARKKYNMLHLNLGWERAMKNTLESFGVERPPLTSWNLHEEQLLKEVFAYARERGIRIVAPAFSGYVPADFRRKYPDIHYVTVDWLGVDVNQCIFPDDPMFVQIGARFLQEYIKIMGTDHIYNMDPFPESDPGKTPEEKIRVKSEYAKAIAKYIKAADPDGIWICSGWAFTYRHFWPMDHVKAFLDACPFDMFIVNDIWAEHDPMYKELDYFCGKKWGFSVLHSMGGWTTVHGDLGDLIRRVQEVTNDPKAVNCVNYYFNPEIVHHNTVYFDLGARLAWRPQSVALDPFIDDYLIRRYGAEAGPKMRPAWDELIASVYGEYDYTAPRYQPLPSLEIPDTLPPREAYVPHLKKAVELALAQKDALGGNRPYRIDLIDMTRQWVAEVYNVHYRQLVAAYKAKDKAAFDRAAAGMRKCLDCQETILVSDPAYSIQPEIARALKLPKHTRETWGQHLKDNGEMVRQRYTALWNLANYPTLVDYCMRDMYELIKFYYRPRMEVVLTALRAHIEAPDRFTNLRQLDDQYKAIIDTFINTPIDDYGAPPSPYAGKPVEAAEAVYRKMTE